MWAGPVERRRRCVALTDGESFNMCSGEIYLVLIGIKTGLDQSNASSFSGMTREQSSRMKNNDPSSGLHGYAGPAHFQTSTSGNE